MRGERERDRRWEELVWLGSISSTGEDRRIIGTVASIGASIDRFSYPKKKGVFGSKENDEEKLQEEKKQSKVVENIFY